MKPRLVPGRWPSVALAAGGVLLALPTLIWPVIVFSADLPTDGDSAAHSFGLGIWSWGKLERLGDPLGGSPPGLSTTPSLVLLVLSLAIGAGGALACALVGREPGRSVAIAGTSFLTAAQLIFVTDWLSRGLMSFLQEDSTLQVALQPAGWLQLASVVLLVASLGFMLWRPMRAWVVPTWRHLHGVEPESEPTAPDVDAPRPASTPLVSAQMLEVDEPVERSRPVDGPAVSFSDTRPERRRRARGSEPPG